MPAAGAFPGLIAEIGFNHGGDLEVAERMIAAAARAGAGAVKFQSFRAGDILLPTAEAYPVLQGAAMDLADHRRLAASAGRAGVQFISTPFSPRAVELLEHVGVPVYKVASMDLANFELLDAVAATGKPAILSTGMATLAEIAASLERWAARSSAPVALLHCLAQYPSPAADLELGRIPFFRRTFGVPVGYSDHHPGVKACLAAGLLGAEIIETHFTLDHGLPGGDHAHSADPQELEGLVRDLALMRSMLGGPGPEGLRADRENARAFRRGVYAARDLSAGRRLAREDLLLARPEAAFGPNDLPLLLGRALAAPVAAHQALAPEHL
jgi:sialic acid synthase SpsE